jgi:hypothetical protein
VGPRGGGGGFPTVRALGAAWGAGGGGAAGPGGWLGRRGAHSGKGRGWGGWAAREGRGGLGRKGEEGGGRKEKVFLFSKIYFLDECFHNFNQSKQMHGSTWCNKPK